MPYARLLEAGQREIARARWLREEARTARGSWRPISGGAGGPESDVRRAAITAKLAAGALPRLAPSTMWAGKGRGNNVCTACDQPIEQGVMEYEPEFADGTTRFLHQACLALWHEERAQG